MTSGFVFNDDGSMSYMVNTSYYGVYDDEICFNLSCRFHKVENKVLSKDYEIMRANIEQGKDWNVMIDFVEDGKDKFRVYKVINTQ
jgi:hypothetical protein